MRLEILYNIRVLFHSNFYFLNAFFFALCSYDYWLINDFLVFAINLVARVSLNGTDEDQKLEFSEEDEVQDAGDLEAKVNTMLSRLRGRAESLEQDSVEESGSAEIEPAANTDLQAAEEAKVIKLEVSVDVEENEITPTKHQKKGKKHDKNLADLRDRLLSSSLKRKHSLESNEDKSSNSSEYQVIIFFHSEWKILLAIIFVCIIYNMGNSFKNSILLYEHKNNNFLC